MTPVETQTSDPNSIIDLVLLRSNLLSLSQLSVLSMPFLELSPPFLPSSMSPSTSTSSSHLPLSSLLPSLPLLAWASPGFVQLSTPPQSASSAQLMLPLPPSSMSGSISTRGRSWGKWKSALPDSDRLLKKSRSVTQNLILLNSIQCSLNGAADAIWQVAKTPEHNIQMAMIKVMKEEDLSWQDKSFLMSMFAEELNKAGVDCVLDPGEVCHDFLMRELLAYKVCKGLL